MLLKSIDLWKDAVCMNHRFQCELVGTSCSFVIVFTAKGGELLEISANLQLSTGPKESRGCAFGALSFFNAEIREGEYVQLQELERNFMLGVKPGWCWTGVTMDVDLLRSEMENKGPFVGMQGSSERGEPKENDPTFLVPYQLFGCEWIIFMDKNFCAMFLN